jgi:hypothetical protein
MSLLTICQNASDEVGIDRPVTVASNTNGEVQKLYRMAKKVGLKLMKTFPWQVLRSEQTFTSLATETQTAILPSDFDRFVPETFWNRTDKILISGPVHAVEWQSMKAIAYGDANIPKFAHRGDTVLVIPTLSAGKSLAFEYVSKNWCQSSGSVAQATWAADDDTGIIDEELITLGLVWEYLHAEGLPAGKAGMAYKEYFDALCDNDQPDGNILVAGDIFGGGRHHTGTPAVSGFEVNT